MLDEGGDSMSIAEALITAEEFAEMPDDRYTELVEGRIIELPPPNLLHGRICYLVAKILGSHVDPHDLGTIFMNDAGIITRRNPDSVRGADVAYFSFARLPRGPIPQRYSDIAPEIIFEVRSPSDRWRKVEKKVAEYLHLGALVVCVLDPKPRSARLYYPNQPARILGPDDELTFPEILPGFVAVVRTFFE
jgi:Uma2 family endonuclease